MNDWTVMEEGIRTRIYDNEAVYLDKQAEKLNRRPGFAANYSLGLRGRLSKTLLTLTDYIGPHQNVVCLGARVGGEVGAFIDAGHYAVGVDINPGEANRQVLYGDFHNLVFANESVDIVYTNSLDHALHMDELIKEVHRVLKPGGIFLTENKGGIKEPGFKPAKSDAYDCTEWKSLKHLIAYIQNRGFRSVHRYRFKGFTPWGILYRKTIDPNHQL